MQSLFRRLSLVLVAFLAADAMADSCPYCGQTYGGGPSGSSYIASIRAAHEASCSMRNRGGGGGRATYYPPQPSPAEIARQQAAQQAQANNEAGVAASKRGDYGLALHYYKQANAQNPNDPVIGANYLNALANAEFRAANYGAAITNYEWTIGRLRAAMQMFPQRRAEFQNWINGLEQAISNSQDAIYTRQQYEDARRRQDEALRQMQFQQEQARLKAETDAQQAKSNVASVLDRYQSKVDTVAITPGLDFDGRQSNTPPGTAVTSPELTFMPVQSSPPTPVMDGSIVDLSNTTSRTVNIGEVKGGGASAGATSSGLGLSASGMGNVSDSDIAAFNLQSDSPFPPPTSQRSDVVADAKATIRELAENTRAWLGDEDHQQWAQDALGIGSSPLLVRDAMASVLRPVAAQAAAVRKALPALSLSGDASLSAQVSRALDGRQLSAAASSERFVGGGAASAFQPKVGLPKHVSLTADEFSNIDLYAKNIVYHITHPNGEVSLMEWMTTLEWHNSAERVRLWGSLKR